MDIAADLTFPRRLLHCPAHERVAYFKGYTVAHTCMEQVFTRVVQAIQEPANAAYIVVVGPTGVGKTTLRLGLEHHFQTTLSAELAQDPGRLPICSTTAISPDNGTFNWKEYYRRALQALHEPLIADKVVVRGECGQPAPRRSVLSSATDAPALRRALEQALHHRRPQAFIVDEAQHLLKMASGRRLQDQMDCIKSLADHGQTVHVLLGTYDLLALQALSGQLIRRGLTLHFPRYRADSPAEVTAFQRVLVSFEQHLPVRERPDLFGLWPYCFERSVGCVGILKDWLTRALAAAVADDAPTLTQAHLAQHALSPQACERILDEALAGEEQLREREDGARRLRMLLGFLPADASGNASAASREESSGPPSSRRPSRPRPGERVPVRDPLKQEAHHAG